MAGFTCTSPVSVLVVGPDDETIISVSTTSVPGYHAGQVLGFLDSTTTGQGQKWTKYRIVDVLHQISGYERHEATLRVEVHVVPFA